MTTTAKRPSIISTPGARALFTSSIVARLPLAMFGIALLVHAERLTGSYAAAGIVTGAYACSEAAAAPIMGRLIDRCGQTRILLSSATISAVLLVAAGLLPAGAPVPVLVLLAGGIGLATPPLGASINTLLPTVFTDPAALPAAYAFESTWLELTFIFGPPLALGLGAVWSTGAALGFGGVVMLAATGAFVAQPASRSWRPEPSSERRRGGSLRSPAIRALVLVLVAVGAVFGAVEVGVAAAAKELGASAAAGPLLGLWGLGSLLGGIAATRLGSRLVGSRGLKLLVLALALGHGALIAASGSTLAIGAVLLLAGASIAPTFGVIHAMVDKAAPAGTRTEAFAWLMTASSTGACAGAIAAGAATQGAGAPAAFVVAGVAGTVAVLIAMFGGRSQRDCDPKETIAIDAAVAACR